MQSKGWSPRTFQSEAAERAGDRLEVVAERLDLGPGARPTLFGADGSTPLPADQQPFGDLVRLTS